MSGHEYLQKRALGCLRMEADCMRLARSVRSPRARSHFLEMAGVWSAWASAAPSESAEAASDDIKTPTT